MLIKVNGRCPCPRCLIVKPNIANMGQENDMRFREEGARSYDSAWIARVDKAMFNMFNGRAVNGDYVDGILTATSETPTKVRISIDASSLSYFL